MNIVAAFKVVPDDQDIQVDAAGGLDFSKAHMKVSEYDLNALEEAAQLAKAADGSKVTALSAGPKKIDDSKLKKNVLARGADELEMIADDACADLDAHATAAVLADAIKKIGDVDVVICGDGSADNYAQQVDVQLGCALGVPSVNAAIAIEAIEGGFKVTRKLEDVTETVEIPAPCVIAVAPDVAEPRIPGMRDILQAGKRPMNIEEAQGAPEPAIETVSVSALEQVDRMKEISNADEDGAVEKFAAALKSAL
jgi:electron transfer flavoprotein beta subunit